MEEFKCTDEGQLAWHLRIKYECSCASKIIDCSQEQYIDNLLAKYGMENCNSVLTPMIQNTRLRKHDCPPPGQEDEERAT
eukprot:1843572-Rhodomonas_salina.1